MAQSLTGWTTTSHHQHHHERGLPAAALLAASASAQQQLHNMLYAAAIATTLKLCNSIFAWILQLSSGVAFTRAIWPMSRRSACLISAAPPVTYSLLPSPTSSAILLLIIVHRQHHHLRQLARARADKGLYVTCMVRSNRRGLPEIATQRPNLNKGQSEWMTKSSVAYVQWMDTKCVHVLSTAFDPNTVVDVKRKQKDDTQLSVTCPKPVFEYTQCMGGVDRFDQRRSIYSVSRRSRKWWMWLLYFIIDAAVVNAYILYNSVHPDEATSMFQFRQNLFRGLVGSYSSRSRKSLQKVFLSSANSVFVVVRGSWLFRMNFVSTMSDATCLTRFQSSDNAATVVQRRTTSDLVT